MEHTTEVVVEGGKIKSYTSTMAPWSVEVAAAAAACQQAQAQLARTAPAGMPRTGGEQSVLFTLLIGLGMLTALVGLGLGRTVKPSVDYIPCIKQEHRNANAHGVLAALLSMTRRPFLPDGRTSGF